MQRPDIPHCNEDICNRQIKQEESHKTASQQCHQTNCKNHRNGTSGWKHAHRPARELKRTQTSQITDHMKQKAEDRTIKQKQVGCSTKQKQMTKLFFGHVRDRQQVTSVSNATTGKMAADPKKAHTHTHGSTHADCKVEQRTPHMAAAQPCNTCKILIYSRGASPCQEWEVMWTRQHSK